jgi:2-methylcitrate dehydratase PrpD
MAELGIGGTASGPYDVFQVGLGAPISKASELNINLGSEWTISDGYHKLYGACHHSHAAMEALEAMLIKRPELRGGIDVRSATVHCSKMAMNFNNATPQTTLGAKFSIPHAVAATLVHGADDPCNFLDQSLSDQAIKDMRLRVNLVELSDIKPWPYDRPAKVSLLLNDGSQLENRCEAALGSSARPLDAAQVLTKIHQLSADKAPGLQKAVIKLREEIGTDHLGNLDFSRWVQSFYRG